MRCWALFFAALTLRADSSQPVFATYLGGGGNEVAGAVATDAEGNVYVAGRTDSPDFPVKNATQAESRSYSQAFIAKFGPTGELLYSTYFGGSANDAATAIATDSAGNVYVAGMAQSKDFPTVHAFQAENRGGTDAFVLKLDSGGNPVYATLLGGKFNDHAMGVSADNDGNAYVTGRTESPDFPITPGVVQQVPAGFRPGYTFVSAFVTKLDPAGGLVYSTYLGGSGYATGWGIAVDAAGQAHVAGETSSFDFPTTPNAFQASPGRRSVYGVGSNDAFLAKLSADGSSLIYSTLLGGPSQDSARAVALDPAGNAYITGTTLDARLPIVGGAQPYLGGDVYRVSTDGGLTFSPRRSGLAAAEVTSIAFDPGGGAQYAGTRQGVFRSSDGGETWTPAGLDAYWILQLAVDPSAPGTLYAGTSFGGGVFRSTDGGDTWTSLCAGSPGNCGNASFAAIAVDPAGSGTVYVVAGSGAIGNGYDQPLYRVTGDGVTWTLLGKGLLSSPLAVAIGPDSKPYAGTASISWPNFWGPPNHVPGSVYRFESGAWIGSGFDDNVRALAFQGSSLLAAGRRLYRSEDGGRTWSVSDVPGSTDVARLAADPRNAAAVYAVTSEYNLPRLLRSTDGGAHFDTADTAQFSSIAVNPADSSVHAGLAVPPDAYLAVFDPSGSLVYSTFLGGPLSERGDGIAVTRDGNVYVVGFRSQAGTLAPGTTFVVRAGAPPDSIDIGPSTAVTVLETPSRGIAAGPDGSLVAAMIATEDGLPVANAAQPTLHGSSDIYIVKWKP